MRVHKPNPRACRWCTLRIAEANTQVLIKVLDMLKEVMSAMEAHDIK
jgi:hypothetical protein